MPTHLNTTTTATLPLPSHNDTIDSSRPELENTFDTSVCLFCNQANLDPETNLTHMSKAHGFFVDPERLVVDIEIFLTYLNHIISEDHECLYCGTQRRTQQAVQQHRMDRGHCQFDLSDEDCELTDFFDLPSPGSCQSLTTEQQFTHLQNNTRSERYTGPRGQGSTRRPRRRDQSIDTPSATSPRRRPVPTPEVETDADVDSPAGITASSPSGQLTARAAKRSMILSAQVSHIRASDQRSLSHLPHSQQRALLATQHTQMETVNRTEQLRRGQLGSAGNLFGCLSKTRLMRKPPHYGWVSSLKR